jgi:hypothetical protein
VALSHNATRKGIQGPFIVIMVVTKFPVKDMGEGLGAGATFFKYLLGV